MNIPPHILNLAARLRAAALSHRSDHPFNRVLEEVGQLAPNPYWVKLAFRVWPDLYAMEQDQPPVDPWKAADKPK